jgi:hypothetical protein
MTIRATLVGRHAALLTLVAVTGIALSACSASTTDASSPSRAAAEVASPSAPAAPSPSPSSTPEPSPDPIPLGTRICIVNGSEVTLPIKATEYDTLESPSESLAPGEQSCASRATATVYRVYSPDKSLVTRLTAQSKAPGFVVNVLKNPNGATGRLLESKFGVDEGVSVNVTPFLFTVQRNPDTDQSREFTVTVSDEVPNQ